MDVGDLDPEAIHLPNIFVDRIVVGGNFEKRIEVTVCKCMQQLYFNTAPLQKRTLRKRDNGGGAVGGGKGEELRERIIRRAALEFEDGMFGTYSTCLLSYVVMFC